ncbi:IS30 family transposase [Flavobacterium marginilacus]|uniref:IS30 family transposase n=1 Tax=Flavobacterium marginilacus TaxID=3003256 RepID=UPI00248D6701|nr:IS30 family transposase [Flavobacterium marginilacus]
MAHLTLEQRYKIEVYRNAGISISEIAELVDKNKSVIFREIKRNSDQRSGVYKAVLADKKALNRHKVKIKKCTLTSEVEANILFYLKQDYSPEQIVGRAKIDKRAMVSKERIYQYIWENKRKGGLLYKHLRTKGKKYKKRGHLKDKRGLIIGRVDISERPKIVEKKSRLGDLEIDLVIGKNHKGALLTINDRASGILFMGKVESKEASAIQQKTIELLKDWKPIIKTITSDNGKEFANHRAIAEDLDIDYYFAKPYHSWERGANENLNGLIRQYFPKKSNFENIEEQQIKTVVNTLNNRPRKRFGYKTPNEIFAEKINKLNTVAFIC